MKKHAEYMKIANESVLQKISNVVKFKMQLKQSRFFLLIDGQTSLYLDAGHVEILGLAFPDIK